jgi:hypothetical protein
MALPGDARIIFDMPVKDDPRLAVMTAGFLNEKGELDPDNLVVKQLSRKDEQAILLWCANVVAFGSLGCSPSFFS